MKKLNNWDWYDYDELGSTNDEAKLFSQEQLGKKYIVTTKIQTQGRGRRGRSWIGLEGNLFMSLAWEVELKNLGQIIFITSLSQLQTIKEISNNVDVKLKWPNDVLVDEHKISGTLLEKGEGDYLIIGIGINITEAPKIEGLIYPAISLADVGIKIDRIEFLRHYVNVLDKNLALWHEKGFAVIKETWLRNVKGLNEFILVNSEQGQKRGVFKGVDDNGMLLLGTENGIEKIYAGDVLYESK